MIPVSEEKQQASMEMASIWGAADVTSRKGMKDENFPVGSILIAPVLRPAVHAYYRFARVADDMVDNASLSAEEKITRLEALRDVLEGRRAGIDRADVQSAVILRERLLERGLPLEVASDLITAFSLDARKNRYENWSELVHYCRYSANPVGRFLLLLHGEGAQTFAPSDSLCTALQILNHLQDMGSDLKLLDRCYLPLPWLAEVGIGIEDLRLARCRPGVRLVIDRILAHVDALNEQAGPLIPLIRNRRMRLEAAVIWDLCCRLTERLYQQDPLAERVVLSKADIARATMTASRYMFRPLFRGVPHIGT